MELDLSYRNETKEGYIIYKGDEFEKARDLVIKIAEGKIPICELVIY